MISDAFKGFKISFSNCTAIMKRIFMFLFTTLVLFFVATFPLSDCKEESSVFDSNSEWTPFCDEELYYKPYIRVREGRNGAVIKDMEHGLFEVKDLENLYVCANGLVFLYFKIHEKELGEIYDDGVMQYASHYCGFYNGKPGPGMGHRETTLVAILLLGHSKDYRQVALQMFNAPLYNSNTKTTSNFISLAIINTDGECILEKGRERARIRIKGNPSEEIKTKTYENTEEHHTTICRLDGHLLMQDDPTKIPLDSDWASKDEVLNVLSLSQNSSSSSSDLNLLGCYKYPLLDNRQIQIIQDRKTQTEQEGFDIGTGKSELNPEDGAGLQFWTAERIAKFGNPATAAPADEATLTSDISTKNGTLQTELAKAKDASDAAAIKTAQEELNLAVLKLKLAPYLKYYQSIFELAKSNAQSAKESWEKVSTVVNEATVTEILKNYTQVQEELSLYHHQQISEPYNTKLQSRIEEATEHSEEFKGKLWTKTLEVGPQITKAEVMSARRSSYVNEAKLAMEKIENLILVFEKSKKPLEGQWDFQEPVAAYKDTVVSVKNPPAGGGNAAADDNPACLTFERKEDQCKSVKPSAKRACQLAKIKLSGAGDWPGGAGDAWRDEILELLDKIFTKGCNRLRGDFAKGINSIVKGYLIKKPEVETDKALPGAPAINHTRHNFITNYKISKPEDLYPPLPGKDAAPWDEILEKLRKCEEHVQPLDFAVESSSSNPLRIFHSGKPVPNILEQADLEFSFNWAVDSNFRIFSTALGLCANEFDGALAKKFYNGYTQSFLDPIRPIWLSNRDNPIFKVVMGRHYVTGKGDLWTRQCMEASFIRSGKPQLRPVRNLFVNSYTEPNFIAQGPGQGTRGPFYAS